MIQKYDFLVIGGGIAGMCYALSVANSGKGKVALVCKTTLDEANTAKAQGGVAAVTNLAVDNFEKTHQRYDGRRRLYIGFGCGETRCLQCTKSH